ncbi:hypothetical protein AB0J74_25830 [Asanoa sp. NPDC049573]|uniref:hypothetical protein n=1 Tax=Asanoa sp. NPDC049573 TaxID=3155396 RepID=UPI00344151D4
MNLSDMPSLLGRLYERLRTAGFTVTSEQSGGMGGLEVILSGSIAGSTGSVPAEVDMSSDRGHSVVTVRLGEMEHWIIPGVWASYLDSIPVDIDPERATEFLGNRLSDMADAYLADDDIESKLVAIGEQFMRARSAAYEF